MPGTRASLEPGALRAGLEPGAAGIGLVLEFVVKFSVYFTLLPPWKGISLCTVLPRLDGEG